jgi:hypothetical protein
LFNFKYRKECDGIAIYSLRALCETANSSAVKSQSEGANNMKMTEQQTLEYKLYREGCQLSNVEPVRADFLAGEIPDCVISCMEFEQNENEWARRKAMGASA